MSEKETLESLKVDIAGRLYPLKVEAHEKELVEVVVRNLNKKIRQFQRTYSSKDMQDCLAMTLFSQVFDAEMNKSNSSEEISVKVSKLENLLDELE